MTPENTQDESAAIKGQMFTLLVALIVISGTLTGYLFTQASITGKEQLQLQQLSAQLQERQTIINEFEAKLRAYGEKHPDFAAAMMKKYGITPAPAEAVTAPAPKK